MPLTDKTLFASQLIAHIGAIFWIYSSPSMIDWLIVLGVYFVMGCLGMSVTYHRLLTHRSFQTTNTIEKIGTIFATVGLTGSSLSWTAAHRQHHKKADCKGDPHSPKIHGYFSAQYLSMFSQIDIYKSPVIGKKFHHWVHRHYFSINAAWAVFLWIVGGYWAILTFWLVPAAILWNAGSLINTVCHCKPLGYRRYNLPDSSVNNAIMGICMWGEGWHNNHHRFQNRARIGEKWWEIDIGWWIISAIRIDKN